MKVEKITLCHKNSIPEKNNHSLVFNCNGEGVRRALFACTLLMNWGLSNALTDKEIGQRVINAGIGVLYFGAGLAVLGSIFCAIVGTIKDCYYDKNKQTEMTDVQPLNTDERDNLVNSDGNLSLEQKHQKVRNFWITALLTTAITGAALMFSGLLVIVFGSGYCFSENKGK